MLFNASDSYHKRETSSSLNEALLTNVNIHYGISERRVHYRFPVAITLEVSLFGDDGRVFAAVTEDLSCGGIRIACNRDLEEYSLLNLHLIFCNEHICIKGRVIHMHYSKNDEFIFSYGIEFADISVCDQKKISQFILDEHKNRIRRGE